MAYLYSTVRACKRRVWEDTFAWYVRFIAKYYGIENEIPSDDETKDVWDYSLYLASHNLEHNSPSDILDRIYFFDESEHTEIAKKINSDMRVVVGNISECLKNRTFNPDELPEFDTYVFESIFTKVTTGLISEEESGTYKLIEYLMNATELSTYTMEEIDCRKAIQGILALSSVNEFYVNVDLYADEIIEFVKYCKLARQPKMFIDFINHLYFTLVDTTKLIEHDVSGFMSALEESTDLFSGLFKIIGIDDFCTMACAVSDYITGQFKESKHKAVSFNKALLFGESSVQDFKNDITFEKFLKHEYPEKVELIESYDISELVDTLRRIYKNYLMIKRSVMSDDYFEEHISELVNKIWA